MWHDVVASFLFLRLCLNSTVLEKLTEVDLNNGIIRKAKKGRDWFLRYFIAP